MKTSSKIAYNDKIKDRDMMALQNRDMNKNAAERPNFKYGNDAVKYQTTNTKAYTTIGFDQNKKTTKQE